MQLSQNQLISMLNKVRVVREHLERVCPNPQGPVLSLMDLHWAVQDVYNLRIDMVEVTFPGTYLKGKVERYADNRARIFVRSSLALYEKRFVAAKELCHLIIDEKDDWSTVGVDTLHGLLTESVTVMETGQGIANPAGPLQSEYLAQFAASEFLYPGMYHNDDMAKVDMNHSTVLGIALQHDVPAYLIEHSFRHKGIMDKARLKIEAGLAAAAE